MKVTYAFFALLWLVSNTAVVATSGTLGVRAKILDEDDSILIDTRIIHASGENNRNLDVFARLGDRVWNDLNADGIQDPGELGIVGVTVKLLNGTTSTLLAETTTDASGNYFFNTFNIGTYQIQFILSSGYTFSPPYQGQNDALDSDADPTTGLTQNITLETAGEINLKLDAGMYMTPQQTPQPNPQPTPQMTPQPTPEPTSQPTPKPSPQPTMECDMNGKACSSEGYECICECTSS